MLRYGKNFKQNTLIQDFMGDREKNLLKKENKKLKGKIENIWKILAENYLTKRQVGAIKRAVKQIQR